MNNKELCLALMRADTEAEVVAILSDAGYWDNPVAWRNLGDVDNNFSSIGNQQSEAVAALIEKIVNSIDARLTNACLIAGIAPESGEAPQSIREAVARFFEEKTGVITDLDGHIADWTSADLTNHGRLLTLAATGNMPEHGRPCLSIADQGEGQCPDAFPETFMSLQRSNKMRIHFVQGKFNMGGTGALQFCSSEHRFQLIVSRRNPALVSTGASARDNEWGFTIARRERPKEGAKSSTFTYLAPVGAAPGTPGAVLSFPAETFPIFPEANEKVRNAYSRQAEHGSLVKLFEYEWQGTKSNIVSSGGALLRRIDLGMPELALPVRVFECRAGYKGHGGSFATNVLGLASRLDADKASNLEPDFPVQTIINLEGCPIKVRLYAFKKGKAADYRLARHGIVFTVNGQSHATFPLDFFRRKAVQMGYLADSLLVIVDCSAIDGQMREDLFMNSRDRLRDTPLAQSLEKEFETLLKHDATLRVLRNARRQAELADKLEDSKPLVDILQDLLKKQPTLAKLFLKGVKLPSAFPMNGGGGTGTAGTFEGKPFPTFFRFRGMKTGETLQRDGHQGSRLRVAFETDAENSYFASDVSLAACRLLVLTDTGADEVSNWTMHGPSSGVANLTIPEFPAGTVLGDHVRYRLEVTDCSRVEPFVNEMTIRLVGPSAQKPGGQGKASTKNTGVGTNGGAPQLALPNIKEVEESDWGNHPGFNELTALRVVNAGEDEQPGVSNAEVFDFFVNVDNKFLRISQKESKGEDPKLLRARYVYSNVLIGLALIQERQSLTKTPADNEADSDGIGIEDLVERTTRALSPVILPMLEIMGALEVDEGE